MGAWKRCSKCGGRVTVLAVIRESRTDLDREAWICQTCRHMEIVVKKRALKTEDVR
jgi:DNA-directed RNA polymerase subunit RPC12/RpoP